jgi:hypothetical protein
VCWIRSELCDLPRFDGTGLIDTFLAQMEESVPETQRIQAMDVVVKGTPVLVGDAPHRSTGMGIGGGVYQSKVPSHD